MISSYMLKAKETLIRSFILSSRIYSEEFGLLLGWMALVITVGGIPGHIVDILDYKYLGISQSHGNTMRRQRRFQQVSAKNKANPKGPAQ